MIRFAVVLDHTDNNIDDCIALLNKFNKEYDVYYMTNSTREPSGLTFAKMTGCRNFVQSQRRVNVFVKNKMSKWRHIGGKRDLYFYLDGLKHT